MEKFTSEKKISPELSSDFIEKSREYLEMTRKHQSYFMEFNMAIINGLDSKRGSFTYEILNNGPDFIKGELMNAEYKTPPTDTELKVLQYLFDNIDLIESKSIHNELNDLPMRPRLIKIAEIAKQDAEEILDIVK